MPAPSKSAVRACTPRPTRHGLTPLALAMHLATRTIFGAVLAVGMGFSQAAQAQATAQAISYDIPAGPLGEALSRFAQQSGVAIVVDASKVQGLRSPGLKGGYGVAEGFSLLLRGSGYAIGKTAAGYVLVPAAAPSPKPDMRASEASLPTVKVMEKAVQETASGPVAGYVAKRSATGTKTDTPITETPQSISVVTADQMQAQKAQTLQDAFGYSAGVMTEVVGLSPLIADSFFIRGFQADSQYASFYRDGMRYMANIYHGKQEPYGLERLEVLKGPASVLYGAAAPGGIVNAVSKRPTLEPLHEVNVEYGSHNRQQLSADFGGALDADGVWSYRLTALTRSSGTHVDFGRDDRTYVAPALTWSPSAATSLTLLASYQRSRASDPSSLPLAGTVLPNRNGKLPTARFLGEPSWSSYDNATYTAGYLFEHAFSDAVKVRHGLRSYRSDLDYKYVLLTSNVDAATERMVGRQPRWFVDDANILTSDTHLEYAFATGPVDHKMLIGADYTRVHRSSDRQRGTLNAIDAYNPVYGSVPVQTNPWRQFRDSEMRKGLYLQDQLKFAQQWTLLLGGRQDWMDMEALSLHAPANNTYEKEKAFTGRAGLVYEAQNGLAPYASFSQSFEPTSGQDRNSQRFKPTTGEQYEVGLRYQPQGSNTLLSAALYQLNRTHVLTPDPVDASFSVQTGEVRSRGLELEAKSQMGRNLSLIAAYTYTDAVVVQSNVAQQVNSAYFAPRHLVSVWADYGLASVGLPGWRVGGGVRHVSDRPDTLADGSTGTPAYTLVDARLGYEQGPWRYAVNVGNLTDQTYIPSQCRPGFAGGCSYGNPRTVTATASYRW
ncbi:MAG: TonB-dependent siderophore receptor [Rhodoferax sp.]|nr:TonB-dependent siderophore receptor [Rhodoferax sp.]MDP3653383.1 TonB-dependent siderophore receptor [Rhodoferax sp.]